MPYVIGLVGKCGAGKSTFTKFLREIAVSNGCSVGRVGFSDILMETLHLWGIESTRENLQKLAVIMNNSYGDGILSKAVFMRASEDKSDIIILDGIRWKSDVEMLKLFPRNMLIHITADPGRRFERMKARKEKLRESEKTFEQFLKEEESLNEVLISDIGAKADIQFENVFYLHNFEVDVISFFYNHLVSFKIIIRQFLCMHCEEIWETSDGSFPDVCPSCGCGTDKIKEKSIKGN